MKNKYIKIISSVILLFFIISNYTEVFNSASVNPNNWYKTFINNFNLLKVQDSLIDKDKIEEITMESNNSNIEQSLKNNTYSELKGKLQILLTTDEKNIYNNYNIVDFKNNNIIIPDYSNNSLNELNVYKKVFLLYTPNEDINDLEIYFNNSQEGLKCSNNFKKDSNYLLILPKDLTDDTLYLSSNNNSKISSYNISTISCINNNPLYDDKLQYNANSNSLEGKFTEITEKNGLDPASYSSIKFLLNDEVIDPVNINYNYDQATSISNLYINLENYKNDSYTGRVINVDKLGFISSLTYTFDKNKTEEDDNSNSENKITKELKFLCNNVEVTDNQIINSTPAFSVYYEDSNNTAASPNVNIKELKYSTTPINSSNYSSVDNLTLFSKGDNNYDIMDSNDNLYQFKPGYYSLSIEGDNISKTYNFLVDNIKPTIQLKEVINNNTNEILSPLFNSTYYTNSNVTVRFDLSSNTLPCKNVDVVLISSDGSEEKLDYNNNSVTIDFSKLAGNNSFTLHATATSDGNNKSEELAVLFKYNTTSPTINVMDYSNKVINNTNNKFTKEFLPKIILENSKFDYANLHILKGNDLLVNNSVKITNFTVTTLDSNGEYNTTTKDNISLKLLPNEGLTFDCNNFTTGIYSFNVNIQDNYGNTTSVPVNFSISTCYNDIDAKLIYNRAGKTIPCYDNVYYIHNNFLTSVTLTPQLYGYKSLSGTLYDSKGTPLISKRINNNLNDNTLIPLRAKNNDWKALANGNLSLDINAITNFGQRITKSFTIVNDTISPKAIAYLNGDKKTTITDTSTNINYCPNMSLKLIDENIIPNNSDSSSININKFQYCENYNSNKYTEINDYKFIQSSDNESNFYLVDDNNNKVILKNGKYKVNLKILDKALNSTTYTYEFIVDSKTPELEINKISFYNINNNSDYQAPIVFNDSIILSNDFVVDIRLDKNASGYSSITGVLGHINKNGVFKELQSGDVNKISTNKYSIMFTDLKNSINKDNDDLILKISATTGSNLTSESYINVKYDTTAPELKLMGNNIEISQDKLYKSTPNIHIYLKDFTINKDYFNNKLNTLEIKKFTYSTINTSKDINNLSLEAITDDYNEFIIKENGSDFEFKAGSYNITLCATDSLGHKTTKEYSFVIDSIYPKITSTKIYSNNKNILYNKSSYPNNNTFYINDDFTIEYKLKDNLIGYSNLSISLLDNNKVIYETSDCVDNNCPLDGTATHKYKINIPDSYKNSSSKNFTVKTVLTSNGNGDKTRTITKYFKINYDDIEPNIILHNNEEIKNNDLYTTSINPIVRISDFNSDKSIITINDKKENLIPNSIKLNSAKLTYVNNDTLTTDIVDLQLKATSNHNEFKFIDSKNNDYTFSEGQYTLSLSYKDINGNESLKEFKFNIEMNPKSIKSTLDLPKYNDTYYANSDNFNVEVDLPLQLIGYKELKVHLLDSNYNIIDTFNYNDDLSSKGKYIIPINCNKVTLYNSTSKNFIIKVSAKTTFNNSVEEYFNNVVYDNTAPNSSLKLVDDNTSTTVNSIDANDITSINYTANPIFEIRDPNLILNNETSSHSSAKIISFSYNKYKDDNYDSIINKVKLLQIDYSNYSIFKVTDLSGKDYKLENGFYKITIETDDKNNNSTTYDYEFIVDTNPVNFTNTINVNNNSTLNHYNDTYYINNNIFTVTTNLEKSISGYKDLSLKLTTLDGSEEIIGKCSEESCNLDSNNSHKFEFDLSKICNSTTGKFILTSTLINNAGSSTTLNYNIIYDINSPNGTLDDNNSEITGILNYLPNNPILKISDENINENMTIVKGESEIKPNSIFIKKFSKDTLINEDIDLVNSLSLSLDNYTKDNSNIDLIYKFINTDNSAYAFDDGIYDISIMVCDLNGNIKTLDYNFTIGSLSPSGNTIVSYKTINNTEEIVTNPNNTIYVPYDGTLNINIDHHISGFKDSSITVQYTDNDNNTSSYPLSKLFDSSEEIIGISDNGNISEDIDNKECTLKFTEEGSYVITTTVNTNSEQPSYISNITIVVDKTAPTVDLVSNNTTGAKDNMLFTNSSNPTITYIAKDKNLKSINKLSVNGVEVPQNDLNTISQFTNDGIYQIEILAEDHVGRSSTKVINLTVDKVLPTITLPTNLGFNNVGGINFTNRVSPYNYSVTDDYLESENCTVNGIGYSKGTSISGDGDKLIEVTAKDYAGNVKKETFSYRLDTISPELSIDDVINDKYYNINVLPKYNATDLHLDTSSISATVNDNPFNNLAISADGTYSFKLYAKDYAGNYSEKNLSFIIDKIAPLITFEGINEDEVNPGIVTPKILIDDPTATVTYFLNGEEYYGEPIIDNKKFTLLVTCVDKAGNFSKKAISFMVDSFGPEIALELQGIGDVDKKLFEPGIKPIITVTKNASYTILLDGKKYNGEEIYDEGSHTIEVRAKDSAGNITNFKDSFVIVKNIPLTSNTKVKETNNNPLVITTSIVAIVTISTISIIFFVKRKRKRSQNN